MMEKDSRQRTPPNLWRAMCLWLVVALGPFTWPAGADEQPTSQALTWSTLPQLPTENGLGGPYAGTSGDALIVAGGANFPDGRPWEGAEKVWHDRVYVLPSPESDWETAVERLPHRMAYGVSVTWNDMVICAGGSNGDQHFKHVVAIAYTDQRIEITDLPSLPQPCAFMAGAIVEDTLFIAGGQREPNSTEAMKTFWALDLAATPSERKWRVIDDTWPGSGRILPVAGALNGSFFLFSGAKLIPDDEGGATRKHLRDAYRYDAVQGWRRLASMPRPTVAAPTPAPRLASSHLAIIGGDTGEHFGKAAELKDSHPGFAREVLAYHPLTDAWSTRGRLPTSIPDVDGESVMSQPPVTTVTTRWHDRITLPSGEIRPGVRTENVLWAETNQAYKRFGWVNFAVLGVYLALLVGIGGYFSRREWTTDDFFLGGRRIPWWAAGLSIFATQLSAITFVAIPGKVFATDWTYFLGNMMIVAVAPVVIFFYLPFFRRLNVTSAYEYLEKRFNLVARLLGSTAFVLLQLGRMGVVLFLPALALSAVTGLNVYLCIALMGGLATLYTVLGGIEAVIWTDVLQVILLLGGATLTLVLIAVDVDGGIPQLLAMAAAEDKLRFARWTFDPGMAAIWVIVLGFFAQHTVSYTSDQTVVQRYLTTADERLAARSVWTNAVITVPASLIFFATGTALWGYFKTHPAELAPLAAQDQVFPWFIAHELPIGIAGLVIAALFAASMSSLDSSMNSVATAITTDWYRRFNPQKTDRERLRFGRILTVLLGIIGTGAALILASGPGQSMWDQYVTILGLFGGALAGLFAAGIFTRTANGIGAIIGFCTSGILVVILWTVTEIHPALYAIFGMGLCFVITLGLSLVTPPRTGSLEGLTLHTLKD